MASTENRPRHLWLALLPVFLVSVVALSCGDPPALPCAAYCSGCCTAEGVCLSTEAQSNGTCGLSGDLCSSCAPGLSCIEGYCSDGTGPDCGADGQQCCDGEIACSRGLSCDDGVCRVPPCGEEGIACCEGNQCTGDLNCISGVCRAEECGGDGQQCCPGDTACDGGLSCRGGICNGTGGDAPIGATCTTGSECERGACRTGAFTGGYCTADCGTNSDCPGDSLCVDNPFNLSLGKMCLDACPSPGDASGCRAGYVCDRTQHRPGNPGVCIPACDETSGSLCGAGNVCNEDTGLCAGEPGYGCNPGGATCNDGSTCVAGFCPTDSGPYGQTCENLSQCGASSAKCIPESTNSNWGGGYCSGTCNSGLSCEPGGSCSVFLQNGTASDYFCLANCEFDGGQSSCRDGYVCDSGYVDGSSQAVCVPNCNAGSFCANGETCNAQGFCQ